MKTQIKFFVLFIFAIFFTSCLRSGLDELPTYHKANITNFSFEYRYVKNSEVQYVRLNNDAIIDTVNNTVNNVVSLPFNFPQSQKDNISLENIVGMAEISPAATIYPIGGAPKLGSIGDFSNDVKYKVVAANRENKKIWIITTKLTK